MRIDCRLDQRIPHTNPHNTYKTQPAFFPRICGPFLPLYEYFQILDYISAFHTQTHTKHTKSQIHTKPNPHFPRVFAVHLFFYKNIFHIKLDVQTHFSCCIFPAYLSSISSTAHFWYFKSNIQTPEFPHFFRVFAVHFRILFLAAEVAALSPWSEMDMWDMTHSYMRHDSCVIAVMWLCETWLIHTCGYVRHDSFIHETWLMCDCGAQPVIWYGETWLIYMCSVTHSCVRHDWFICVIWPTHVRHDTIMCVAWLIRMWDMTLSYETWLNQVCSVTHSYVRSDSCLTFSDHRPSSRNHTWVMSHASKSHATHTSCHLSHMTSCHLSRDMSLITYDVMSLIT